MELSNFGGGHLDDETVILLGNDANASFGNNSTAARPRDVTVIVTEGTLPPTTVPSQSSYNNRRHPPAALTPTLTTATPVASSHAITVPELVPLLPTGPADHYVDPMHSHNAGGLPVSSLYPLTPVASGSLTFGHVTEQTTESSEQPKHKERRSRKGSRAPQPPSNSKKSTSGNAGETSDSVQPSSVTPSSGKTGKDKAAATSVERPAQAHSFHTEAAAEVQKMEKELLTLLSDFNTGKLRAFGHGCSMEAMEQIRDQQENLAKLHFDLAGKQDLSAPLNEEAIRTANDNMDRLMTDLERLSMAIGKLDPAAAKLHQSSNDNTVADELPTYRRPSTYAVSSDMAFTDNDR